MILALHLQIVPLSLLLLFFLLLLIREAPSENHAKCYEYESFCLFTLAPSIEASDAKRADDACRSSKALSRLFRVAKKRHLNLLVRYVSKVDHLRDAPVILHAREEKGSWNWIPDRGDPPKKVESKVLDKLKTKGGALYYQLDGRTGDPETFKVVCMINCWSKRKTHEGKGFSVGATMPGLSKDDCREACESSRGCSAWGWSGKAGERDGCKIYNGSSVAAEAATPNGELVPAREDVIVLDRSSKNVKECVGAVRKTLEVGVSPPSESQGYPFALFWPVVALILVHICLGMLRCKKKLKARTRGKKKENVESPEVKDEVVPTA